MVNRYIYIMSDVNCDEKFMAEGEKTLETPGFLTETSPKSSQIGPQKARKGPRNPLSNAARWRYRVRAKKALLRRIDGQPDDRHLALIGQILDLTWDMRVAKILGERAMAAGDTGLALQYARLRDRHRTAWMRLDRAFTIACRPPPPPPRTLAEIVAARKRQMR